MDILGKQPSKEVKQKETYVRGMANQVQDSSFLIYQLQTDDILEQIEMDLKGYDWNPMKKTYEKTREQMINNKGISVLITILKIEVNRTKILSDFNKEDIPRIMMEFENNIIEILENKYKEWEIEFNYLSSIRIMLGNAVYATYKRALEGGERDFLKGDQKRIETYSEKERDKTLLNAFNQKSSKW